MLKDNKNRYNLKYKRTLKYNFHYIYRGNQMDYDVFTQMGNYLAADRNYIQISIIFFNKQLLFNKFQRAALKK